MNYLTGGDVFTQLCSCPDGKPSMCVPVEFDGAIDEAWRDQADGGFRLATEELLRMVPDGNGLGVAAWDSDGSGHLSVFVPSDTVLNYMFVPDVIESGDVTLTESATLGHVRPDAVADVRMGGRRV